MHKEVLLLNASEEVLKVINWKRAVKLIESGKAQKPHGYNKHHNIRTSAGEYKLPAALVLIRYVQVPWNVDVKPTRKNIFKRDKWSCQYCGKEYKDTKKLTLDHVHPRSKGGDGGWTNLVTACRKCNLSKGNKLLKECSMKLKNKPKKPTFFGLQMIVIDENGKEMWSRWLDFHMQG